MKKENKKVNIKGVYLLKLGSKKGLTVWLVNGSKIRRDIYPDFVFGGNDKRYAFIPPKEIWIDGDVSVYELEFTTEHEIHERNLMARGMSYEAAHREALKVEREARLRADKEIYTHVKNLKPRRTGEYD